MAVKRDFETAPRLAFTPAGGPRPALVDTMWMKEKGPSIFALGPKQQQQQQQLKELDRNSKSKPK
jgi:hypothetical protein